MIHRTRLLLDGATLLAALALASPSLLAQEAGRRAAPPENAPESVAPERAVPAKDDAAQPATRKPRREVLTQMREAEVVHRERLAAINRLRQLAESQGQSERLALLDKLEVKEDARYGAAAQFAATHLGNTSAYKQSLIKLAAGRIRREGVSEAKPVEPGQTPAERKARKEAKEAKKTAERAASKPAETPAVERPKGDAPKADAPKADRPKTERKQRVASSTAGRTRPGSKHKRSGDASSAPRAEPKRDSTSAPRDAGSSGSSRSPRSDS